MQATEIFANAGTFKMDSQLRIMGGRSIVWDTGGTLGPNVWSTNDPGAANYPDGSLWLQP